MSDTAQATAIVKQHFPDASADAVAGIIGKIGEAPLLLWRDHAPAHLPDVLAQAANEIAVEISPPEDEDAKITAFLLSKGCDLDDYKGLKKMELFDFGRKVLARQEQTKQAPKVLAEQTLKSRTTALDRLTLANAVAADTKLDPMRKLATANAAQTGKVRAELARAREKLAQVTTDEGQRLYASIIRGAEHKLRLAGATP